MRSRMVATALAASLVATVAMTPEDSRGPAPAESAGFSTAASVAVEHVSAEMGRDLDVSDVRVTDEYTSGHNDVTHVYLRQLHDGLEILGAEATVNVKAGKVVHAGARFLADPSTAASGERGITAEEAIRAAAESVGVEETDEALFETPLLAYRKLDDATARLVYRVQLVTEHHWWSVSVDAETGEILHEVDYVDHEDAAAIAATTARPEHHDTVVGALHDVKPVTTPDPFEDGSSYKVFPMPLESPLDGIHEVIDNPADAIASPFGWHDLDGQPGADTTTTRGNNVNAYADTIQASAYVGINYPVPVPQHNEADPLSQPEGGEGLDFHFDIPTYDATPLAYREAAVTNLFFWNNVMHDVTYRYGFDEAAGNFQHTNYTPEGLGGDAVNAEAQDGNFVLNANFATPPDGSPGRMQMFMWVDAFRDLSGDVARVHSNEVRDGDLDAGVIAHEYGHGISNRLVGGPSNVECLRTHDERQGEGWSDWWSYALTMREGDDGATPRGIGNYVIYYDEFRRQGPGIRITPYSTDRRTNPSTYNTVKTAAEPHGVGYVWASMLWDMYWALVDEHGFNPNPYEDWSTGGNNLAIQLVVDGMKFAPCEPGFADARDAIIAADAALTADDGDLEELGDGETLRGENYCLIWKAFADRGLGTDAVQGDPKSKVDGQNGFALPVDCQD